jgi:hypothetical protein
MTYFSGVQSLHPLLSLLRVATLKDSIMLQGRITWYTTLLGKKQSIAPLKRELAAKEVPTICTTEFKQGRTSRWGLAWSFHAMRAARVVVFAGRQQFSPRGKTTEARVLLPWLLALFWLLAVLKFSSS